jgi:hypothetical protein
MKKNNITFSFLNDIELVLAALENGDIEDAIKILEEIKEEQENLLKGYNPN